MTIRQELCMIIKLKSITPSAWKNCGHSDKQEMLRGKSGELQTDLPSSTIVKTLLTMPCNWLSAVLDRHSGADRAGFRKTFRTTDHPMTYKPISQKSREWRTDMWVAAIDVKKAFDSIQHEDIWNSLRKYSISEQYICLLKKYTPTSVPR